MEHAKHKDIWKGINYFTDLLRENLLFRLRLCLFNLNAKACKSVSCWGLEAGLSVFSAVISFINNNSLWKISCPNWFIAQQSVSILTSPCKHKDKNSLTEDFLKYSCIFFFTGLVHYNELWLPCLLSIIICVTYPFSVFRFCSFLLPQCTWSYQWL